MPGISATSAPTTPTRRRPTGSCVRAARTSWGGTCSGRSSGTCWPSCPTESANASAKPTGARSTTPPTNATEGQRLQALVDELDTDGFTAAARCLADDLDALVVDLRYPTRHRRRWRSTKNLLERSLAEVKRRTKVIGRFPGETSCLTLVWAVLDLYITHAKNGVRFSQVERQRLRQIRHAGSEPTIEKEASAT